MKNSFRKSVIVSLILVYLVIAAGSIVRMTGSGMGCPDWPKCFGYWIPPTEKDQLDWKANHPYKEGQVIILEEELRVAKNNFLSTGAFNANNWDYYTKHNYAIFNAYHTWIEYINRLLGVLAGLAILVMTVLSFWSRKRSASFPVIAVLILLGMGFQAWLGKIVVDSNLTPYKISLHMGMALLIVLGLIFFIFATQKKSIFIPATPQLKLYAWATILLTLFQIGLGTQVRQYVDTQMHQTASLWLDPAPLKFYIHRSLSLLVLGAHLILFLKLRKHNHNLKVFYQILGLIGLEIITGIIMYYLDFPSSSQPIHLILAALLFGCQSFFILQMISKRKSYDL